MINHKMIHQMKLINDAFQSIKSKTETIEMRLCDEKRQLFKVNDIITFENIDTKEQIKVKVIAIKILMNYIVTTNRFNLDIGKMNK